MRNLVCGVVCLMALGGGVPAAGAQTAAPDTPLRVFLDCQAYTCDLDFLRTEINFVDHVRDRRDADVHVLVTGEATGSGGRAATLRFIGQQRFSGRDDVLSYATRQTDTADEIRHGLAQTVKLGLVRYLADTPVGSRLQIRVPRLAGPLAVNGQSADDPWRLWVFRARFNGAFNGEHSSSSRTVSGVISANRTTEAWRINLASSLQSTRNRFLLGGDSTFTSVVRSTLTEGLIVKSLSDHWSVAARGDASSSTFQNQDLSATIGGGVEYNVFPYAESTNRMLTLAYTLGLNHFDYTEETLFGRFSETRGDQMLRVALDVKQPWGQAGAGVEVASYLHDASKHHIDFDGELDVRIVKGLTFTISANAARVRDQLYLPREEATTEEILVRQRELATSYRYSLSFGISYTFGSIFNNVVNPRFGG